MEKSNEITRFCIIKVITLLYEKKSINFATTKCNYLTLW